MMMQSKRKLFAVNLLSHFFGQSAPISAHDVESLHLSSFDEMVVDLLDAQCRVFLLLQKQHRLEDTVNVDFQQTIEFVHLCFDLRHQTHYICTLKEFRVLRSSIITAEYSYKLRNADFNQRNTYSNWLPSLSNFTKSFHKYILKLFICKILIISNNLLKHNTKTLTLHLSQ